MSEYDHEPIRGLPGDLPPGEAIVWQGAPDWRIFARAALHTRWLLGYFALLAGLAAVQGSLFGVGISLLAAGLVTALLTVFAVLVARTTVYTLTNRRIVLRIGVALNTCINLPLSAIGSADLRELGGGFGDIALVPSTAHRIGYAMLWPHARPWQLRAPQPMLRAVPDAARVAQLLARACEAPVSARPVREAAPVGLTEVAA